MGKTNSLYLGQSLEKIIPKHKNHVFN